MDCYKSKNYLLEEFLMESKKTRYIYTKFLSQRWQYLSVAYLRAFLEDKIARDIPIIPILQPFASKGATRTVCTTPAGGHFWPAVFRIAITQCYPASIEPAISIQLDTISKHRFTYYPEIIRSKRIVETRCNRLEITRGIRSNELWPRQIFIPRAL